MPKKRIEKKVSSFEAKFRDILVCQNNDSRPYLEIFIEEPENIARQKLGTIAGILEITDNSEDSSYIVNYLISLIKKEYYSNIKRGAIESFEAALHKVNLALAKLAEHGNVGWMGKINAIIAAVEKNNIHLAQTGNAHAFLFRANNLTDIGEGAVPNDKLNPLKTFVDVLSGRIHDKDRVILATEGMFDVFSFDEIKRSAIKFSPVDFVRFLHTALVNELERAAVLIIGIQEKLEDTLQTQKRTAKKKKINAFSQASFSKAPPINKEVTVKNKSEEPIQTEEEQAIFSDIQDELEKKQGEFVDKKTGHIYIKENAEIQEKEPFYKSYLENAKFKFKDLAGTLSGISVGLAKKAAAIRLPKFPKIKFKLPERNIQNKENKKMEEILKRIENTEKISAPVPPVPELTETISQKIPVSQLKDVAANQASDKIHPVISPVERKDSNLLIWNQKVKENIERYRQIGEETFRPDSEKNIFKNLLGKISDFSKSAFSKIRSLLPSASGLKILFSKFNRRQKIYATFGLILLLVVPYFIAKISQKNNDPAPAIETGSPAADFNPLSNDKNIMGIDNLKEIYSASGIISVANINNNFFTLEENNIVNLAENKIYPLPDNFKAVRVAAMDDLNLAILMNSQNQAMSWSPSSGKFQDNIIEIPPEAQINSTRCYLTYLYVLDGKNRQIYRYPRAEGGFGAKVDWLKEDVTINPSADFAVSDNIYLANGENILKLFRGKIQEFNIEETATPIEADKIYTKIDYQYIYVLDLKNSRIVKLDLNGAIISQYYNAEIKNATDLTVDESANLIYFSTPNSVKSFGM